MDISYALRCGREYDMGNEILRYRIRVPLVDGCDRINSFYEKIANECEAFCKNELAHGGGRTVRYELDFRTTEVADGLLSLVFRARLMLRGEILDSYIFVNIWNLAKQRLVPPQNLPGKYRIKGEKIKKYEDTAIFDKKTVSLSKIDVDSLFERKNSE